MKREPELIRLILLDVEKSPAGSGLITGFEYPDYDQDTINEHVELLINAGFLDGQVLRAQGYQIVRIVVRKLEWQGHDFLNALRNDTIWGKVKSTVVDKGLPWTMEFLVNLGKNYAGEELRKHGINLPL